MLVSSLVETDLKAVGSEVLRVENFAVEDEVMREDEVKGGRVHESEGGFARGAVAVNLPQRALERVKVDRIEAPYSNVVGVKDDKVVIVKDVVLVIFRKMVINADLLRDIIRSLLARRYYEKVCFGKTLLFFSSGVLRWFRVR